jgi:hypothetical protein
MWTVQGHSPRQGSFEYEYTHRERAEEYFTACRLSEECTWLELVDPNGIVVRCA